MQHEQRLEACMTWSRQVSIGVLAAPCARGVAPPPSSLDGILLSWAIERVPRPLQRVPRRACALLDAHTTTTTRRPRPGDASYASLSLLPAPSPKHAPRLASPPTCSSSSRLTVRLGAAHQCLAAKDDDEVEGDGIDDLGRGRQRGRAGDPALDVERERRDGQRVEERVDGAGGRRGGHHDGEWVTLCGRRKR